MGTRAITNVIDNAGNVFVSMYRQYDGYPEGGHGEDLARWLKGAVIGNGIRLGRDESINFFNGIGDLACRLITFFKEDSSEPGSFYMLPLAESGESEEFVYTVKCDDGYNAEGGVRIRVESYGNPIFTGTPEEMLVWIRDAKESEDW